VSALRASRTAIDRWTLAYSIVVAALIAWRVRSEQLLTFLAVHVSLAALALLMPRARLAGPVGRFLGDWYPLLLLTALYTEIGLVNLSDGRAYDRLVLAWLEDVDSRLRTVDPHVAHPRTLEEGHLLARESRRQRPRAGATEARQLRALFARSRFAGCFPVSRDDRLQVPLRGVSRLLLVGRI